MSRCNLLCRQSMTVARTWLSCEQMQAEDPQHQQDADPIPAQVMVWRDALITTGSMFLVGNILIANKMVSKHS
jgi:hypothetical protein